MAEEENDSADPKVKGNGKGRGGRGGKAFEVKVTGNEKALSEVMDLMMPKGQTGKKGGGGESDGSQGKKQNQRRRRLGCHVSARVRATAQ